MCAHHTFEDAARKPEGWGMEQRPLCSVSTFLSLSGKEFGDVQSETSREILIQNTSTYSMLLGSDGSLKGRGENVQSPASGKADSFIQQRGEPYIPSPSTQAVF